MFYAPKYARLSLKAATDSKTTNGGKLYDLAKLNTAVKDSTTGLRLKDGNFLRPIDTPVVGYGNDVPTDWDPEDRGGFSEPTATDDDIANDIVAVAEKRGWKYVGKCFNQGADLRARNDGDNWKPYKLSGRKLSDDDKAMWIYKNKPDMFKLGTPIHEFAKMYDQIHGGG